MSPQSGTKFAHNFYKWKYLFHLKFYKYTKFMSSPLKSLIAVVFFGWLMVWIITPTQRYRNEWKPKIRELTNSNYFGKQGTNLVMYCFPIIFISVVGCFYLHMVNKKIKTDGKKSVKLSHRRDQVLRRPVLINGPLGIVSMVELAFCLMFVTMLVWYLAVYINTGLARIKPNIVEENGQKMWQAKLENVALRFGLVGNLCLAFLFFPVTRGSSILSLVGLTSESSIRYHIWLGHITMTLLTSHGLCYIIFWASTNNITQMIKWATDGVSNVAGEITLMSGLILWTTTFPCIRRKFFEVFYYTHQLYVVFLVFYLLHVGIPFFSTILPGVYLFMVDRYLRFMQSSRNVRLVSARILPSETVELNFLKTPGLRYTPTSNVFINIPSISSLQWHPFTVTSCSNLEPERLSVIIKKEGKWTQKLYEELTKPSLDKLKVSVEGPYGPSFVDLQRHDTLVMVSGGSGITPFISIIRELIYQTTVGNTTPNILLVAIFKTSADLAMLDLLLPMSTNISDVSNLNLKIEAYVTRENFLSSNAKLPIQNKIFKPNPFDTPLSSVLGQNNWLWLAAVILSSFVAYLVLIGMLTRYYIYPYEQINGKYSITLRALFHLFFLCASIVAVSSVVVIWNTKKCILETKQVRITQNSSSSWYNSDTELESVPNESLVQATRFHFGGRPDLKQVIYGVSGSSIGMMVSGPSSLRRDVATICSSGFVKNLEFESISFNW